MTPDEFARLCAAHDAQLRAGDPRFAAYLDDRAASARRRLHVPVLATPEELAAQAWDAEQAERCYEQPALWGVMD